MYNTLTTTKNQYSGRAQENDVQFMSFEKKTLHYYVCTWIFLIFFNEIRIEK